MADLISCLQFAVGLVKNDCACIDTDSAPEDYDRSDSGYYLDDMEIAPPLAFSKAAADCSEFWDLMTEAREQGIRDFITDFVITARQYTTIKVSPYDGEFTDNQKINMVLTGIHKQYLAAMYRPIGYVRGATMEIRKVGLIMNMAGTYTVNVYDSSQLYSENITLSPLKSIDVVVTTPGVLATANVPSGDGSVWKFPMWKDDRKLSYYFVYDPVGAKPYNVRFNCGCSKGTRPWEKYLYGRGVQTDDIKELELLSRDHSPYSYGLYLSGSLSCDGFDWMCRNWNYQTDSFARVMARLIQLYSIRKLCALILNSRRINAFTLLNRDILAARMEAISRLIMDPSEGNMPYLYRNIPKGVTGCWECESKFKKAAIIV